RSTTQSYTLSLHDALPICILDLPHAAEYVNAIGQAVQAAGGRLPTKWLSGMLHRLKHQGPERVLKHLSWLAAHYPGPGIQEKLADRKSTRLNSSHRTISYA